MMIALESDECAEPAIRVRNKQKTNVDDIIKKAMNTRTVARMTELEEREGRKKENNGERRGIYSVRCVDHRMVLKVAH